MEFEYRSGRARLYPGQLDVLQPGEVHTGSSVGVEGWVYRCFYPSSRWLSDTLGIRPSQIDFPAIIDDPNLARLLSVAHKKLEDADDLEATTMLHLAFEALATRHGRTTSSQQTSAHANSAARQAREFLEAHATEKIDLPRLARLVDLHPVSLVRAFCREFGLPPHAYQLQRRLQLARFAMARRVPTVQAALEAGFTDQSHLSRAFKRAYGITPGQYARAWA